MTNLEDLELSMDDYNGFNPLLYGARYQEFTRAIFATLGKASKLHQISLVGDWVIAQADLLAFVTTHASTLCHLILYGVILNGS